MIFLYELKGKESVNLAIIEAIKVGIEKYKDKHNQIDESRLDEVMGDPKLAQKFREAREKNWYLQGQVLPSPIGDDE